ncbi:hypothetical protein JTB14_030757 [Gonioctena quinquepunctata]|nr:hypothetical protein JTB14_030757 [Gonioctena quinquepunctata]
MDYRGAPPMEMTSNVAENWKLLKRFQTYLLATEISNKKETTQYIQLSTLIGEEGIYNTSTMLPEEKEKINPLFEKFENHFSPRNNLTYQIHKFLTCKQQEGESIVQYVSELKNLADSSELGTLRNSSTPLLICGCN